MSCLGLLPPFKEQRDFRLPTHQGCQSSCLRNIQSTMDTACSEHSRYIERLRDPSEGMFTQYQLFLTPCSTHFTDDDQSCMDTHTDSKLDIFRLLQTGIEVSHGIKDT